MFAVALVAHFVDELEHQLFGVELVLVELFFAGFGLGVGLLFDFGQDFLRTGVGRQLGDDEAPLAACQFFDFVAGAHADAAFAGFVELEQVFGRGDDVAAAGEIGGGSVLHQLGGGERGLFEQGYSGGGNFAQVVRRDFGGHAHGNAGGAVEQHHGQAGGQGNGLFKRAVVIRHKIHRALMQLGKQQFGNRGEAGFGVAHGGRAVAIARAEVADAVD